MSARPFDALVITSIAPPTEILRVYARECSQRGIHFILIGDTKSPADFYLPGCDFYSIERQRSLPFHLARLLPERHYARKNLGYLIAWQAGARIVAETDDDNIPLESFWQTPRPRVAVRVAEGCGWVNVFRYFSAAHVWPRGYPLERVQAPLVPREQLPIRNVTCFIQQGLADENPDVDAVYRMTQPLPVCFSREEPIGVGRGAWCPFNSQNTVWFREAAPLMYLPAHCSFRMTDIWRSFVAHRIGWEYGWHVLYTAPTVRQERNEHNLLRDFADEVPGYLHNTELCAALAEHTLSMELQHMTANLRACYKVLRDLQLVGDVEETLLDAWCEDIKRLCSDDVRH
ncbi:MAG: STELLO glycosyltransferase family protein [bacterium]|nr:STELLO glycosyltransferase family protein [bacterium]